MIETLATDESLRALERLRRFEEKCQGTVFLDLSAPPFAPGSAGFDRVHAQHHGRPMMTGMRAHGTAFY